MNCFSCRFCSAGCWYTRNGRLTGCDHYPLEIGLDSVSQPELTATDLRRLRYLSEGMDDEQLAQAENVSPRHIKHWRGEVSKFLDASTPFQLGLKSAPFLERKQHDAILRD